MSHLRRGTYSSGHINRQTTSRLMSLPPELRWRIWKLVFGGHIIRIRFKHNTRPEQSSKVVFYHITAWHEILGVPRATSVADHAGGAEWDHVGDAGWDSSAWIPKSDALSLLSALSTCRQVYEDAWNTPFKWNLFYMENIEALYGFFAGAAPYRGSLYPHMVSEVQCLWLHYDKSVSQCPLKSSSRVLRNHLPRYTRRLRLEALKKVVVVQQGPVQPDYRACWSGRELRHDLGRVLYTPRLRTVMVIARLRKTRTKGTLEELQREIRTQLWSPRGFRSLRQHGTAQW